MAKPRASAYRSVVGASGDGYFAFAPWVRDLVGASGVYVIRDARTGRVLYVGQSGTGRLYDTLTRHFQRWRMDPRSAPYYPPDKIPGTTYDRERVTAAVLRTSPGRALAWEAAFICALKPRDNKVRPEDCPAARAKARAFARRRAQRRGAAVPF